MVMATGREITLDDFPVELKKETSKCADSDWKELLRRDINQRLNRGETRILDELYPLFEQLALTVALEKTGGKKKEAADLLGWGRNTLTRKMKEFERLGVS